MKRIVFCVSSLSVSIQRRLKKEKKAKRKLQEALDFESRRRQQVERALKHSTGDQRQTSSSSFISLLLFSPPAFLPQVIPTADPQFDLLLFIQLFYVS